MGAHLLDHAPPQFQPQTPPAPAFMSGGEDADWELVGTIPTGNPHTDLDFFTRGGETYASVGTLGVGPNGGGQTIVQLTENGEVEPKYVGAQPSASCLSNPSAALGLQHDVEATPKGGTILNTFNPSAVAGEAQIIVDATDAEGRCHDQGVAGLASAPAGGLEIVDVTDPADPVEIGADEPHRRVAHGQRRPQAPAHRLRRDLRQRHRHRTASATTRTRRARSASTSTASRSSTCPRA